MEEGRRGAACKGHEPGGSLLEVKMIGMQIEGPGAMPVALVLKLPGKDAGAEDGQEGSNEEFIAIDLKAGPRDIDGPGETRDHQAGSVKLGPALEGGPRERAEGAREMKRCGA